MKWREFLRWPADRADYGVRWLTAAVVHLSLVAALSASLESGNSRKLFVGGAVLYGGLALVSVLSLRPVSMWGFAGVVAAGTALFRAVAAIPWVHEADPVHFAVFLLQCALEGGLAASLAFVAVSFLFRHRTKD